MRHLLSLLCGLVLLALPISGYYYNCPGTPNTHPIYTNPPVFVNETTNGKLYMIDQVEPHVFITHVYGNAYEMGYAQGTLLKKQIQEFIPEVMTYMYDYLNNYIGFLPEKLEYILDRVVVEGALEWTYEMTEPYTPQRFYDELHGIADASGVPYEQLLLVHMIPELIKAHCSIVGAWEGAIADVGGTLHQLRALDWSTNGPFQKYPAVTIYHPNDDDGHPFGIVTWTGFIGALTGYSSANIGLCEKVWLEYNGTSSRAGIPWIFVLRDILQYDADVDSAINRLTTADRTCSIYVGLGDSHINQARILEYSYEYVKVGDDVNFPEWADHPSYQSVVYLDKHKQPSTDPCLGELIGAYYGSIDAVNLLQNIAPVHETGDMHVAVYDYANNYMYVSNASPVPPSGNASQVIPAYARPFFRLDMANMFVEAINN